MYDGLGEILKTYKEEIKTLSLIKPTVSIKIDSITDSLVKGKVIKTDIDEGKIYIKPLEGLFEIYEGKGENGDED